MYSPPTKGKQKTKGQKQIYDQNLATVKFYLAMTAGGLVLILLSTKID